MTKNLIILTYDAPHRKTQDILSRLFLEGINVDVIGSHWKVRKNRCCLYDLGVKPLPYHPKHLCQKYNFSYSDTPCVNSLGLKEKVILIAGAGILDKEIVENNIVINVHPGWIPDVRGLDSVKWAIYHNKIIGVTAHIIDKNVDLGLIIERRTVHVSCTDNVHSISNKVYLECINLAIDVVKHRLWENASPITEEGYSKATKRMGRTKELTLLKKLHDRFV